jgi:hypothetical protein
MSHMGQLMVTSRTIVRKYSAGGLSWAEVLLSGC